MHQVVVGLTVVLLANVILNDNREKDEHVTKLSVRLKIVHVTSRTGLLTYTANSPKFCVI